MRRGLKKSISWGIRTLALVIGIIFISSASSALARGGGHGGGHGGHGSGQSGGHTGHSGHSEHHGSHVVAKPGGTSGGTITRRHFTNQNPCVPSDKPSSDCPEFGEEQSQTIPAEKSQNKLEYRFD